MAEEKSDIEDARDVRFLMGRFYPRIQEDGMLGEVFAAANVDWTEHIPAMCEFWEAVILREGGYRGNAILPHVELDRRLQSGSFHGLRREELNRWTSLFCHAVDELFSGPRAERAKHVAVTLAQQILMGIQAES